MLTREQLRLILEDDESKNADAAALTDFIWAISDRARGTFSAAQYRDVILPMTLIRRFECALANTKQDVRDEYLKDPNVDPDELADVFCDISGYPFYNVSKLDFPEIVRGNASQVFQHLMDYISKFSKNVREILENFGFEATAKKLDDHGKLYNIVKAFAEVDLSPTVLDEFGASLMFENLITRFINNSEANGEHFTPRSYIKICVAILLSENCDKWLNSDHVVINIADPACGTAGILTILYDSIQKLNPTAKIHISGGELNPQSWAIAQAELLIKGISVEDFEISNGDSLANGGFMDRTIDIAGANFPFGTDFLGPKASATSEVVIRAEADKGADGRYPAGLVAGDDAQLMFAQLMLTGMADDGRAFFVADGSPLFKGNIGSGDSKVRLWLIENDYVDAIVKMAPNVFINTGINTFVFFISKTKLPKRRGKIQFIDASGIFTKLRKSNQERKNDFSLEDRIKIVELYQNFAESELSQIHDVDEFILREVNVFQPKQRNYAITAERIENMLASGALNTLYNAAKVAELERKAEEDEDGISDKEQKSLDKWNAAKGDYDAIVAALEEAAKNGGTVYKRLSDFEEVLLPVLETTGIKIAKGVIDKICDGLSEMDKTAEIHKKKGEIVWDKDTKDTEIIPKTEDFEEYAEREIYPYVPDAHLDLEDPKKKTINYKIGAEFPFDKLFYKYEAPKPSKELLAEIIELDNSANDMIAKLAAAMGNEAV